VADVVVFALIYLLCFTLRFGATCCSPILLICDPALCHTLHSADIPRDWCERVCPLLSTYEVMAPSLLFECYRFSEGLYMFCFGSLSFFCTSSHLPDGGMAVLLYTQVVVVLTNVKGHLCATF
jgi:hypothetical protein